MFFVRHGDSRHKQEGVIGGPNGCRGLTDTGHRQAAQLGRRITAEIGDDTTAIYSSPLPRAVQTAAALLDRELEAELAVEVLGAAFPWLPRDVQPRAATGRT
ncbi:phosphoglycerate mutase family protein [Nonomuraea sp. NPDC049684]|uniref:phosphoglycerate mutase family protein n=1 Tax=Nonomuraea sp. NPDC049684 TaxID=3364356 RepID=UPI0037926869